MKISFSWLKELIFLPESAGQIGALLTGSGLEVEQILEAEAIKGGLEGMVIGTVLSCEPHPDADKLQLTSVSVGEGLVLPIVCGAPNVAAGQRVVVALVGATLHPLEGEPFKIKKSKIRGQISEGMLCAEDEIGLGKGHEGILVLDTELKDGTPAAQYFGLENDYIFDIGLTPNRADAASHLGVARDLKALLNRPISLPEWPKTENLPVHLPQPCPIQIGLEAENQCSFYSGIVIENIRICPSPQWLQKRLQSIGIGPINNVVDITNYILHEIGQPLHAFDLAALADNKIVIRLSQVGEKLTTLEGQERLLPEGLLVIADAQNPICLAGLMGGKHSGINQHTTAVFLESACFGSAAVRKASQTTGIHTDASFRFERGTDPHLPAKALARAADMIRHIIPEAVISQPIYSPLNTNNQKHSIGVSYAYLHKIIGIMIEPKKIIEILENLDFEVLEKNKDGFKVLVPSYRIEIIREADIAEEILRIYGLDNIALNPNYGSAYLSSDTGKYTEKTQNDIARLMSSNGFFEQMTLSQTSPAYYQGLESVYPENEWVRLLNPLSPELGIMRPSLLFSGLETLAYNMNRKQQDLRFYEFGKIYQYLPETSGYQESLILGLWLCGNTQAETWLEKSKPVSFADLAGQIERIFARMGVEVEPKELINPLTSYGLEYHFNNKMIGIAGMVDAQITKKAGIKQPVFFAQIDWQLVSKKTKKQIKYKEISKFPQVRRDLSLVIDQSISYQQIYNLALKTEKKLLTDLNVFDVYEGQNLGEGKKSYSISFILQDSTQTLTEAVIDAVMQRLIQNFESQLGAVIRGK